MVAFPWPQVGSIEPRDLAARIVEEGFVRAVKCGQTVELANLASQVPAEGETPTAEREDWHVVVDRLTVGSTADERLRDSLEMAFDKGHGQAVLYVEEEAAAAADLGGASALIDGRTWRRVKRNTRLVCDDCGIEYPAPDPRLFSFNSPLGACPDCEGFGNIVDVDMDLVVPDKQKTIREGAIAPWNTPAYSHERDELVALAKDYDLSIDVPFAELTDAHRRLISEGVPERDFGGLRGFFAWLEKRKYKMHVRVFLSRWRSYRPCPACGGARLRPEALAVRVGGKNIAEICALPVDEAEPFVRQLALSEWERAVGRTMLEQVQARLGFLHTVGLGYLTLDRTLRTLSGGESQRVALTSALGSNLVNMLYVLDEPSVGLHMQDTTRLVKAIQGLRDRGNTVIVVEHEEEMIRAADMVVEIGPGAGERGGKVVFQGTPREMEENTASLTGDYLSGRRVFHLPEKRRCAQPRLDSPGRSAGEQSAKPVARFSARCVVRRGWRQRSRQEHAGRGYALSGAVPADAQRGAGAGSLRRRVRRWPDQRRDPGRSKPDRPIAPLEPGDVHQGLRRDPQRVCRYAGSPHAQLHGQPFQLQCRGRAVRGV